MTVYPDLLAWLQAAWRAKHGDKPLNISALCRESGITAPAYYRLEKGSPKPETVAKLATYFGVEAPRRAVVASDLNVPPASPISLIREAMQALGRAEGMLAESRRIDPVTAEAEALVDQEQQLLGRGKRGARGRGKRAG